jgi:RNA-directed DNA polymerase
MIATLNRQLAGWAAFYKFTDHTAHTFRHIDNIVFWKMAHWLGRKYRTRIKPLLRDWYRAPETGQAKTWLAFGRHERGNPVNEALRRLVTSPKARFLWRSPDRNPYILRDEARSTVTSGYREVAMAMGQGWMESRMR